MVTEMVDLDLAVGRAAAFLRAGGWSDQVRALVDELYEIDKVALLAELRSLMVTRGYTDDVVARFDR